MVDVCQNLKEHFLGFNFEILVLSILKEKNPWIRYLVSCVHVAYFELVVS